MMVYHHFFGWPNRILISNAFNVVQICNVNGVIFLAQACKLCVCIFAFLSGYGMFFSYEKFHGKDAVRYCLSKVLKLLTIYWIVLVLEIVFLFANGKSIRVSDVLSNVVLLKVNILHTSWYIRFYIEAMAILTIYHVCIKKKSAWMEILLTVCLPWIVYLVIPENTFTHYFPTFMLGYFFSKYQLFEYLYMCIGRLKVFMLATVALLALMLIRLKFGDSIGPFAVITFMGPPLILVLREITYVFEKIKLGKMLLYISKYSTYYWLLHSIFHSGVKAIQVIAYLPYYTVLILIWVFVLMTPFVAVLEKCDVGIWNFFSKKMRRV